MRIAGLATGMDINQMVSDLMRAQRMPIDKMMQDRQIIQWQMEDYREINRKLDTFRNNTFDSVMRQANMLAKSVSSTNESAVSATAASNAGNTSLRIGNVSQLATAASYNSTGEISGGTKIDPAGTLGSEFDTGIDWWSKGVVHRENIQQSANSKFVDLAKENIHNSGDMVVKVNGKVYEVTTDHTTFTDDISGNLVYLDATAGQLEFKDAVNQGTTVQTVYMTASENQQFNVETPRKTFQVQKGGLDFDSLKITVGETDFTKANGKLVTDRAELKAGTAYVNVDTGAIEFFEEQSTFVVNYTQNYTTAGLAAKNASGDVSDKFVFTANQSLNTVFNEMSRSSVGVSGFYDEYNDKVNVSRTETGVFNKNGDEVTFTGFFTDVLKLNGTGAGASGAQNASFTLNGLSTERQSNTFTVAGMTVNLKKTTDVNEVITLRASTDTDKVFDTIKKFIESTTSFSILQTES